MILADRLSCTYLSTKTKYIGFTVLLRKITTHTKQTGHINNIYNLSSIFKSKEIYYILLKVSQNLFSFANISKFR